MYAVVPDSENSAVRGRLELDGSQTLVTVKQRLLDTLEGIEKKVKFNNYDLQPVIQISPLELSPPAPSSFLALPFPGF